MKIIGAIISTILKCLFTIIVINVIVFVLLIAAITEWLKDKNIIKEKQRTDGL